jgi:hypothetical protein
LAQLVERFHGMEEVTGSNPVWSTKTGIIMYHMRRLLSYLAGVLVLFGGSMVALSVYSYFREPSCQNFTSQPSVSICVPTDRKVKSYTDMNRGATALLLGVGLGLFRLFLKEK